MDRGELTFFESGAAFREWLKANHDKVAVLHVGFYKKGSKRASVSYPESVDEALCFGWVDGMRHAVDAESYTARFTPRRPGSIWSAVNVKRMERLLADGRVAQPGIEAFKAHDPARTNMYASEQQNATFSGLQQAQLEANEAAWAYFQAQPAGYRRIATWWVISAKQEATRQRRLDTLLEDSAARRRIAASLPRREPR